MSETKTNFKNELKSAASLILTFSLPILQHYHIHQNAPPRTTTKITITSITRITTTTLERCCGSTYSRRLSLFFSQFGIFSSDREIFSHKNSVLKSRPQLILIFVSTGGGVLFQAGAPFCTENMKFWPILANLGYFVANLRTFWCICTGLNNALYYFE